jgi:hypothetical protein
MPTREIGSHPVDQPALAVCATLRTTLSPGTSSSITGRVGEREEHRRHIEAGALARY